MSLFKKEILTRNRERDGNHNDAIWRFRWVRKFHEPNYSRQKWILRLWWKDWLIANYISLLTFSLHAKNKLFHNRTREDPAVHTIVFDTWHYSILHKIWHFFCNERLGAWNLQLYNYKNIWRFILVSLMSLQLWITLNRSMVK